MVSFRQLSAAAAAVLLFQQGAAQTFRRLGGCPELGCIMPPDKADFLSGQHFDIRVEVHAPINGSEATGKPADEKFTLTIQKDDRGNAIPASKYFQKDEPELEKWQFTWYEDLFAEDAGTPSVVNVTSKIWRYVQLTEPGEYTATLTWDGGQTTASWLVRDMDTTRKAKNVILFIGDGMTTNMITAARHLAHKSKNGVFETRLALDKFPVVGHQASHSLDSYITDSANSASALNSGHKSTVNSMGVYADSSKDPFDDPKVELLAEIFSRKYGAKIGIVSTAYIADATPGAVTSHTRLRGEYPAVVDSFLNSVANYTWTDIGGVDVLFGGGAEQFYPPSLGGKTYQNKDYYAEFTNRGYSLAQNKTSLMELPNDQRALGIFTVNNLPVWLDRNVYTENLHNLSNSPDGLKNDQLDSPGLKEMTLKAIDILQTRSKGKGYFLMSEAASIDKQMHAMDYDRALGDLLELDDAVRATVEKLKKDGTLKDTLILVTADHGHGFDVAGGVDTLYMDKQTGDREKRNAIGTYAASGLSQYVVGESQFDGFPANWDPRYTFHSGVVAHPDFREDYRVNKDGPRTPAINMKLLGSSDYYVNYKDAVTGFVVNGTLPIGESQGVHSLTDVPVYALHEACQDLFSGSYNNIDVFFSIAECLGLSEKGTRGRRGRWGKGRRRSGWGNDECDRW